jgi:DNA repair exonuclease SbcCD ATPase subunit
LISEEELEVGEIPDDQAQRAIELENTRKELERLDTEFYNAMMNKDMDNAGAIIEQAKGLITELLEESIKEKWKENEKEYLNQKNYADLIDQIEKGIEEVYKLKDQNKFKEALTKVDELIDLIKYEDLPEYTERLNNIRKEIVDAMSEDKDLSKQLEKLIKEFKKNRKKNLLEEAIKNCEDIIQIAEKIGKNDIAEEYRQILEELKKELEKTSGLIVDLKHMIEELSKEGLKLLYDGKIVSSLNKYYEVVKEFDKVMG